MKKNPLIWVIGGVALIYFLGKRNLAKKFNVDLKDITAGGGLLKPYFNFKFSVFNPTNQSATIKSIVGTIDFNNEAFANVNSFTPQIIAPNSESFVSVKVTPSLLSSISQIYKLVTSKTKNTNFRFVGTFNIDNILVPVENNLSV